MKGRFILRLRLLTGFFVLIAIILVGKLYVVQIVHGASYKERAERQYFRPQAGIFERGSILFRKDASGKELSAATLLSGFTLTISPQRLKDTEKDIEEGKEKKADVAFRMLQQFVDLDREDFFAKADKEKDTREVLLTRLDGATALKISEAKIPGVLLEREQWRFYPGLSRAAQTIGFVAYDGDLLKGRYGLERYYEDVLSRGEENLYANFFVEIVGGVKGIFGAREELKGDIVTTLDPTVQVALEEQLKRIAAKWGTKKTGGIIMDPKTGEVYALAIHPSFDLNAFKDVRYPELYGNPMVESVYEMGSIIKPLTIAAGIDAGVITAATTYDDRGEIRTDGAVLKNFDGEGRGRVNMQEVLNQSLNTGVSFVVSRLGIEQFSSYMKAFGLGEETGIDLPGEIPGLISNLESTRNVEHYTASFGQGIAMTPVARVRALGTLASGGG